LPTVTRRRLPASRRREIYRILKSTGTYADTLLALGAAELLARLGGDDVVVAVIDRDDGFEVRCSRTVTAAAVDGSPVLLYPHVNLAKGDDRGVAGVVIHYAEDRERRASRRDAEPGRTRSTRRRRRRGQPQLPTEVADAVADQEALDPSMYLVGRLNEVDRATTVKRGNSLRSAMAAMSGDDLEIVIRALEVGWAPARRDLTRRFKRETLGQTLNPHAGKGTNRPKPDGARRENLDAPAIEEWLKYAGLYSHAYARRVPTSENSADVEILVPMPLEIAVDTAREVMAKLRNARIGGRSVKFEILTVIAYAEILVLHHRANVADALYRRHRLNRIVSGIQVAYFRDLGGGKAVTGLYTLGLPGWFDLTGPADVEAYLSLLDEHRKCLYSLDEGRSDEMGLLLGYRDFLSKEDMADFLVFLVDYGEFVLKAWAGGDRPRPRRFGEDGVRRIVGGDTEMKLSEAIEQAGFRNVARAIRRSTVSEMYWKTERNDQIYEIRYGLGQDLKRKARRPDEFLAGLAGFIHSYNEENARVREQFSKPGRDLALHRRRADVSDADLDAVVHLVEESENPEAVAVLLVAYGFTRAHREAEGEPADQSQAAI